MSIFYQLKDPDVWSTFYERQLSGKKMSSAELEELSLFITKRRYIELIDSIIAGGSFSLPTKHLVNKISSSKKRVVYTYSREESFILKALAQLLYKYDDAFPGNLYSFRKKFGVRRALFYLTGRPQLPEMYSYKVDVSNYFNSIDVERCISELAEITGDDPILTGFISRLLRDERVIYEGEIVSEAHGIMAGVPIASFLANVYLRKLDMHFEEQNTLYARYSDDIIVFAPSASELEKRIATIKSFLAEYGLGVNPEKEVITLPGDPFVFLGFQYENGQMDIAPVSLEKIKAKLRRKARALLRWKRKKGFDNRRAVKAFINYTNRYFYDNRKSDEMTWSRWYFPILTTSNSLKLIDQYTQELIRYICTEKHSKANYNVKYSEIKALGYKPLVAAYYKQLEKHARES